MRDGSDFIAEAKELLAARASVLSQLSFAEAQALPEAAEEELAVAGHRCKVTTFRQPLPGHNCLVVVQLATRGLLGMVGDHVERGLVFSVHAAVREAAARELEATGG